VVQGVHGQLVAEDLVAERAGREHHAVRLVHRQPVAAVAEHVGQVLVQPAAGDDRHQLEAPAHAEQREIAFQGGP